MYFKYCNIRLPHFVDIFGKVVIHWFLYRFLLLWQKLVYCIIYFYKFSQFNVLLFKTWIIVSLPLMFLSASDKGRNCAIIPEICIKVQCSHYFEIEIIQCCYLANKLYSSYTVHVIKLYWRVNTCRMKLGPLNFILADVYCSHLCQYVQVICLYVVMMCTKLMTRLLK